MAVHWSTLVLPVILFLKKTDWPSPAAITVNNVSVRSGGLSVSNLKVLKKDLQIDRYVTVIMHQALYFTIKSAFKKKPKSNLETSVPTKLTR